MKGVAHVAAAAALFASTTVAELDPIIIKGTKFFFKSNGTQFFMRGVAYQQEFAGNGSSSTSTTDTYKDPLADVDACRRDVPLLQELRTNIIRTYAIDPNEDHSECMRLLDDAGIYVISDLSEPSLSINRDEPTWTEELLARYTAVVDELAQYSNVVGFFAGNEVSNLLNNTQASAFVKAAVRDTKAHIKQRNHREMGVGYATNDDDEIRQDMADYFSCDSRESSIDFWGYNVYSWCGSSDYEESKYKDRTEEFADYPVPVFFAEYGCNDPEPRKFEDVEALYGDEMAKVWSGGIIYMYFEEANRYGLVELDGDEVEKHPDFTALSSQMAQVTPTGVQMDDYDPTNTQARDCPPTGDGWNASAVLPPTPNRQTCDCIVRNLTCIAKGGVDEDEVGELFGTVCGLDSSACSGIRTDASKGEYGAVSGCNATEQLSWVFNAYYFNQEPRNRDQACDFDGNARTQQPAEPSGECEKLLEEVGSGGTGVVSSAPSPTGDAASGTSETGSADAMVIPRFDFGVLHFGAYLFTAVLTGAGMILL